MKLEKWALIAEIVSGIAVVITLMVLIIGIKSNTDVTRFSVYADLLMEVNEAERARMQNPEVDTVWRAYTSETGEIPENSPLWGWVAQLFRSYEMAYFAREHDMINEPEWGRFERLICIHDRRARVAGLDFQQILTDEFLDYINSECRD